MKLLLTLLFFLTAVTQSFAACEKHPSAPQYAGRPNIILILTDDMDRGLINYMPNVQNLLMKEGTTFKNYFVNVPNCCPSRASMFRGQFAHHTGLLTNKAPNGGFERFRDLGLEQSNIATWFKKAGYRTAIMGKYLNGYPAGERSYVAKGWDEWYVGIKGLYFNYELNENGKPVIYKNDPADYETDVFARKAIDFISRTSYREPFFLYISVPAPHSLKPDQPSVPAPRHQKLFGGLKAPRSPSFNEKDVSDKPRYIRALTLLTDEEIRKIDDWYRARVRSMQAVDDLLLSVLNELNRTNTSQSTYVFFTSDNGFQLGEHRIRIGKARPYDESTNVPLVIRGPGVCRGKITPRIAQNVDLAPTFADLAGFSVPEFVDGASLVGIFHVSKTVPEKWKNEALIQNWTANDAPERPQFTALRSKEFLYVEHRDGETELYDVKSDPYQVQSIHEQVSPELMMQLSTRLKMIRD